MTPLGGDVRRGEKDMNIAIAIIVGAVVGLAGTIGGVSAYQGSPNGSDLKLYSYSDK